MASSFDSSGQPQSSNEPNSPTEAASAGLAESSAGDSSQVAQAAAEAQPIGNVESISGGVTVTRADGSQVELEAGSPVFQGDIIETGPDGAVGVVLADETTFSMAESGNIVLDEMVYDPGTQDGSISMSVVEGVFTFVSGQIAKTDPDAMTLDTPVATIGIRGTQVGIDVGGGGEAQVVPIAARGQWPDAGPGRVYGDDHRIGRQCERRPGRLVHG